MLHGDKQFDPSGPGSGGERTPRRHVPRENDAAQRDDALRRAVETLSAEICWFLATDADGRAAAALATGSTRPSRRPRS